MTLSDRSSLLRCGGPTLRSGLWGDESFGRTNPKERDSLFSSDAVDKFLKWLARVGDRVGEAVGDPKSRDEGRCCHDRVPARLRDNGGRARGDSIGSWTDPRLSVGSVFSGFSSTPGVSCRGVGSRCSGGLIEPGLIEEALSRATLSVGESSVRARDRARSVSH